MENATQTGPMESFDLRDTIIPFSLLQIAHHFQQMGVGEEIEIYASEAGIAQDLKSILPASEARLRVVETPEKDDGVFRWFIQKKIPSLSDPKEEHHV